MNEEDQIVDLEAWTRLRLAQMRVSQKWQPVLLFRDHIPMGNGSLIANAKGEEIIITVAHLFERDYRPAVWTFCRLVTNNWKIEYISSTHPIQHAAEVDLAVAVVGTHERMITGFSHHKINDVMAGMLQTKQFKDPYPLRSLVSGESVSCIGYVEDGNIPYFISPFFSYKGQSGTGFVDANDNLYVLKGGSPIPEPAKQALKLTSDHMTFFLFLPFKY